MPLKTVTTFVGWFSCIIVIRWMDQFVLGSKETEIELLLFLVIKSKLQKKEKGVMIVYARIKKSAEEKKRTGKRFKENVILLQVQRAR